MGKKKGNSIIVMLILTFLISSFISCFVIFNSLTTKKLNKFIVESDFERMLEQKAYEFYLSDDYVSDTFEIEGNFIIYKLDQSIKYYIYEDNGIFNIRREDTV